MRTRARGRRSHGFRSQLERFVAKELQQAKVAFDYEPDRLPYIKKPAKYIPDFKLSPTVYIEAKGVLTVADRNKLLLVQGQHPTITICLLFGNANNKLNRKSSTKYSEWADQHGFPWVDAKSPSLKNWLIKVKAL